jgi:dTDP-4-dehydrorhamnose 3,5-epimerase
MDALLEAVARAAQREPQTVDREGTRLAPAIDGVVVKRLTSHHDHRGALTPLLDTRDPFWVEPVTYAYEITINPGRIKGWGMHELQADRYFASSGSVRVVLFDGRGDSPTAGSLVQLQFGDHNPGLVRIPPGVWHADQNWGDTPVRIVNFPTHAYNPDEPDKYRLDPHAGVIPFDWTLRDG